MQNVTAEDSSGKPDAWKLARPVWGWGLAVMPALHHRTTLMDDSGKPAAKGSNKSEPDPSVLCPDCNKPMRLVKHAKGDFFSCSDYPNCKATRQAQDGKPVESQPRISEKHKCKMCGKGLIRRSNKGGAGFFWGCVRQK